jgi:hypothetical protein
VIEVVAEFKPVSLTVDIETATVLVANPIPAVSVNVPMLTATIGVPGPSGPTGPAGPIGMQKVVHGSDPNVARPAVPVVYWVGTVQPVNADPDDLLMLKGT